VKQNLKFQFEGQNRANIDITFSENIDGQNEKGEKKKYQKIHWTFEKKEKGWTVATCYPFFAK
jgi:hypothetical protein